MKIFNFIIALISPIVLFSQVQSELIGTTVKFEEVLNHIKQLYVDPVNAKKLTETAIVAMLEELDPHSTFLLFLGGHQKN